MSTINQDNSVLLYTGNCRIRLLKVSSWSWLSLIDEASSNLDKSSLVKILSGSSLQTATKWCYGIQWKTIIWCTANIASKGLLRLAGQHLLELRFLGCCMLFGVQLHESWVQNFEKFLLVAILNWAGEKVRPKYAMREYRITIIFYVVNATANYNRQIYTVMRTTSLDG